MQNVHKKSVPTAAGYSGWSFGQTFVAGEGAMPEKVTVQPLGQGTYTNDAYRSPWRDTMTTSQPVHSQAPQMIHLTVIMGDDELIDKTIMAVNQEVKL
jgi:hypothetical protein